MLSEEEKKAIAHLEWLLDDGILASEDEPYIEKILNLIEKQQAEIKKRDKIIDKMAEDIVLLREAGWLTNINNKQDAIEYYTKLVKEEN